MADETQSTGNRNRGRELAIEGLLHSRFGERPCGAAERALQKIRSSPVASESSAARPAAGARKTGEPKRKTNGRRRFAPPSGRTWPVWAKIGLAAAAAIVLLATVRFVLKNGKPETGGSDPTDRNLVAQQPEHKGPGAPDTVAVGKPPGKRTPRTGEDDPGTALARELAWTENFGLTGSRGHGKGGPDLGPITGEPAPGGPPPRDVVGGIGHQKGGLGGEGELEGGMDGGPGRGREGGKFGAPLITGSPKRGAPGSASLRAEIDACLRKLSFRLQIPEQLPTGYRLNGLTPSEAGDGVMLRYACDAAIARVFVRPSEGPDTPIRKVMAGKRVLQTARRKGLLIAVEDGPADPTECEAWANSFVPP